jgi:hypothetical protein
MLSFELDCVRTIEETHSMEHYWYPCSLDRFGFGRDHFFWEFSLDNW